MLDAADLVVGLPQYGEKGSLNVSVAFGVAAYRLVERYRAGRERGAGAEGSGPRSRLPVRP